MSWDIRSFFIFCSLTAILILGSLTIFSVTSIDISYFLRFLLISIFSILIVTGLFYTVNLNRILSFGWVVLVLNMLLILSVELFGKEINGSKRWLDFGFLSLQPSEFMKISFALFAIQYLRYFNLSLIHI